MCEKTETCCFYVVNSSRVTLTIISRKIKIKIKVKWTLYWNWNIFNQNSFHLRAVEKNKSFLICKQISVQFKLFVKSKLGELQGNKVVTVT